MTSAINGGAIASALFGRSGLSTSKPYPKFRVLLALDGEGLSRLVLAKAVSHCVRLTDRLDILLVNSPREPTSVLWRLLLTLEHSGIDYRLTSTEGDLGGQILSYLNRFQGITLVLVDSVAPLERSIGGAMTRLRAQGYRFVPLSPQRPERTAPLTPIGNTDA